ncbi:MAG: FAD-dependent oxidoreductase [Lentisphaeria bacterium]|nr:FAD-dependent oxidoreductase [Lentisphaeria bacterium]NQZ70924.1 FAD-dependent oxidoreductase [Lentisphaeria bacterium]
MSHKKAVVSGRPKLVVLGTGFAAFSLLKSIKRKHYEITVVSPRNHFLFTPLLPSTTVGTIEFRSIIEPIRTLSDITFLQADCTRVDTAGKQVECKHHDSDESFNCPYDSLVIAVGAVNGTFNIPGVEDHCVFLKELSDARIIRQQIIENFEAAAMPDIDPKERQRLLHVVVVGGGPTGVEFAAEMHDFLRQDLKKWYPDISGESRITLIEAGPQILSSFDQKLSAYTQRHFKNRDINVRTESRVKSVDAGKIIIEPAEEIPFGLAVWSTGLSASPLLDSSGLAHENGRLPTDEFLQLNDHTDIYAIGDCAMITDNVLPRTAQAAQQEGKWLAKNFDRQRTGKEPRPFVFKNLGMLAYIGGNTALADISNNIKTSGFKTWIFWRSCYITKLVSFRNKVLVLFDWFKSLVFGRDISRF